MTQDVSGKFNANDVWAHAVALVSANFRLLAIIAGVFMLLPSVALYLMHPELADLGSQMSPDANDDPQKVFAQLAEVYTESAPVALLSLLLTYVGYSAIVALMGESGLTVGQAIVRGAKSVPTLIVVSILFVFAYLIGTLVVFIPIGLLGLAGGAMAAIGGILGAIVVIALLFYLMARFSLTMPVIMLEKNFNPFAAIARSWRMTAPHQWPIFGFWALLFLVYLVIAALLGGVLGVVAALASGTTAALIVGLANGLIGIAAGMVFSAIAVALYYRLSGKAAESVNETFK